VLSRAIADGGEILRGTVVVEIGPEGLGQVDRARVERLADLQEFVRLDEVDHDL